MIIVGYVRVSTSQQSESIENQKKAIQDFSDRFNFPIKNIFCDEGKSGALEASKRPGLTAAINEIKKGCILVVTSRDRIARDPLIIGLLEKELHRKGARIISIAGEGTEDDEPHSVFIRKMVDALAEFRRLMDASRTRKASAIKKLNNERVGRVPYGKKLAEDKIHLESNESEQYVIKEMKYLWKNLHYSYTTIARILNDRGLFNRDNNKWNKSSIHRILNRPEENPEPIHIPSYSSDSMKQNPLP